jgi:hypothetical protein
MGDGWNWLRIMSREGIWYYLRTFGFRYQKVSKLLRRALRKEVVKRGWGGIGSESCPMASRVVSSGSATKELLNLLA